MKRLMVLVVLVMVGCGQKVVVKGSKGEAQAEGKAEVFTPASLVARCDRDTWRMDNAEVVVRGVLGGTAYNPSRTTHAFASDLMVEVETIGFTGPGRVETRALLKEPITYKDFDEGHKDTPARYSAQTVLECFWKTERDAEPVTHPRPAWGTKLATITGTIQRKPGIVVLVDCKLVKIEDIPPDYIVNR